VFLILCIPATHSRADGKEDEFEWVSADDPRITIDGLPFLEENEGQLFRFPKRAEGLVPDNVWRLSQCPSGGRIRFRSDTSSLAVRATYDNLPNLRNIHAFGQSGIDAYLDGKYVGSVAPRKDLQIETAFYENAPKGEHEFTLYLPLYMGCNIGGIGISPGATVKPVTSEYAIDLPVVFYGTSITQGGSASRPGLSYQAMLSRRLNIDFVNFGFSGSGKGEKEVAELIAEVTASCYVLDFAANNEDADSVEKVYLPFIETLRESRPDVPIVCITPIFFTFGGPFRNYIPPTEPVSKVIRDAFKARRDSGDRNIYLVEGYSLLGPDDHDGLTDGVHPNSLGFKMIADGLEPHLRKILGLPVEIPQM